MYVFSAQRKTRNVVVVVAAPPPPFWRRLCSWTSMSTVATVATVATITCSIVMVMCFAFFSIRLFCTTEIKMSCQDIPVAVVLVAANAAKRSSAAGTPSDVVVARVGIVHIDHVLHTCIITIVTVVKISETACK